MKMLKATIMFFPLLAVFGYFVFRIYAALQNGHSLSKMDWNGDGNITIFEIMEGSDIGVRQTVMEGKNCIEFFSYKDGMPIKTDCK